MAHNQYIEDMLSSIKGFVEENKRLPKLLEDYNDYPVGYFLYSLKYYKVKNTKTSIFEICGPYLDENFPGWHNTIQVEQVEHILSLLNDFVNKNRRLPRYKESHRGWPIGHFLSTIKKDRKMGKNTLELNIVSPYLDENFPGWGR